MEDILFLINSAKLFSLYTFVVRFQVYHSPPPAGGQQTLPQGGTGAQGGTPIT